MRKIKLLNNVCNNYLVCIILFMMVLSYGCDDPSSLSLSYLGNDHQREGIEIEGEPETIFSEEGIQQDTAITGEEPTIYNESSKVYETKESETVSSESKSETTTEKGTKTVSVSKPSSSKEPETTVSEEEPQQTVSTTEQEEPLIDNKQDLLENQDGKEVRVCVAYLGNEDGTTHFCDNKKYYFIFNNSTNYSINLNNETQRVATSFHFRKNIPIGRQFFENTDDEILTYLSQYHKNLKEDERAFVLPHIKAGHVPGVQYQYATWKNRKLVVKSVCANNNCHEDVASISIIGKVLDKNGATKYLRLKPKLFTLNRTIEYTFDDFELVDDNYYFDSYCGFIKSTD